MSSLEHAALTHGEPDRENAEKRLSPANQTNIPMPNGTSSDDGQAETTIPPTAEKSESPPSSTNTGEIGVSRNDSWETLIERLKTLRVELARNEASAPPEKLPPS